jgi:hypothetical protein
MMSEEDLGDMIEAAGGSAKCGVCYEGFARLMMTMGRYDQIHGIHTFCVLPASSPSFPDGPLIHKFSSNLAQTLERLQYVGAGDIYIERSSSSRPLNPELN